MEIYIPTKTMELLLVQNKNTNLYSNIYIYILYILYMAQMQISYIMNFVVMAATFISLLKNYLNCFTNVVMFSWNYIIAKLLLISISSLNLRDSTKMG